MSSNRALYEQVILEHNRKPRNFREMPDATCKLNGYNPLCGDQFTFYVKLNGDVVEDISFQGSGCAISKSSASIMTTLLSGKTKREVEALYSKFHKMITSNLDTPIDQNTLGKLVVFSGVRAYPVRIKCATLPWHTILCVLKGKQETVSTE